MSKAAEVELNISSVAYGGLGIARNLGKVVMVPDVLPGETVLAKITADLKGYSRAVLQAVLKPSPHRIGEGDMIAPGHPGSSDCQAPSRVPGCVYQSFSYPEELRVKNLQLGHFLKDICGLSADPCPSIPHLNYRNKITLHAQKESGRLLLGYREEKSHNVCDLPQCTLAMTQINEKLREIRAAKTITASIRSGDSLTLRFNTSVGVLSWVNKPPNNLSWLKENTPAGLISVPAGSFYQVNPGVSDTLMDTVVELVRQLSPDSLVDLYCGCGFFSVAAAFAGVRSISGMDSDQSAIEAARYNLGKQGIDNFNFLAGKAEHGFQKLLQNHRRAKNKLSDSVLLADPPRQGIPEPVLQIIGETRFKAVIYVSCSPDTLTRDAGRLLRFGYQPVHASLLDMFPRTMHFESVMAFRSPDA